MITDHRIVSWVYDHLDELEWYESSQGGSVTRRNGITIHVSMAGILLSDGFKSCRVQARYVKKLMDTEDYTAKEITDMISTIRTKAVSQIMNRMDNPEEKERIRKELFDQLSDGGYK